MVDAGQKTIRDFGQQWLNYTDTSGFYGSSELLADTLAPFLTLAEIKGLRAADIGSGQGRHVNLLLEAGAAHVVAVEPSSGMDTLKQNVFDPERVTFLAVTGDRLPAYGDLDLALAIGVLHHIPDPRPVVEAVYAALRPGGRFLVWLYGRENAGLYLLLVRAFRTMTTRWSHKKLTALAGALYHPLKIYVRLCRRLPLPLQSYTALLDRMSPEHIRCIIYDQLNPTYTKHYTRSEAHCLLAEAGFQDVRLHHRRGYSWTVMGVKPSGRCQDGIRIDC